MKRALLAACAVLVLLGAAPLRLNSSEIAAENAHWTALGVKVPAAGILRPDPYEKPYNVHSFVVPSAWYGEFYAKEKAGTLSVQPAELRADLPTLQFLMQKVYAGYNTVPARAHWNWGSWFAQWSAMLSRSRGPMTIAAAFAPWAQLESVQIDNHSGAAGTTEFNTGSDSAQLGGTPSGACTLLRTDRRSYPLNAADKGQQPHAVQVWNGSSFSQGWYVGYPSRDGAPKSIFCGHDIALHAIDRANAPAKAAFETLADGIGYLRMPSFSTAGVDAIRAAVAKDPNLGKERVMIFDLRGNAGGGPAADVLSNWYAQSALDQASQISQSTTQSCFQQALFFGLEQQVALELKPPASAGETQFLQNVVDLLAKPVSCDVNANVTTAATTLADRKFTRAFDAQGETRGIALVDGGCSSDCEYMAAVLAALPGTVVAGASTYGDMGFTEPGYFMLPHSRVAFRLALSKNDAYGDGRSVDGYGIAVDVVLPNAQSQSRESLVALARALL